MALKCSVWQDQTSTFTLAAEEHHRLAEERRRLEEEGVLRAYYSGDGHHPYQSRDPTELDGYNP